MSQVRLFCCALFIVLSSSLSAATLEPSGKSVPNEVLVKMRPHASANEIHGIELIADSDESEVLATVASGTLMRVHSRSKSTEALASALAKGAEVEFVEPNYILKLDSDPNDPAYPQLWGLENTGQVVEGQAGSGGADIDVEAAWNVTTGSRNVVVAVVDTGIDYAHPDLIANLWVNPGGKGNAACAAGTFGFNAVTGTCDPRDDNGHGTHVAGTIGAVGNNGTGIAGVNWAVSIMALKFLKYDGYGTTADAIAAIDFAIQAKIDGVNVRVLSNSWGGGLF
jgi:subtilisin family serine protease